MEHEPIPQMKSDRKLLRYAYYKPLMVKFHDKCEWQNEVQHRQQMRPGQVHRWIQDK